MNDTDIVNESLHAAGIDNSADRAWNPQDFQVPRFFAFDVGALIMRCLLCAVLAAFGMAVLHGLFAGGR